MKTLSSRLEIINCDFYADVIERAVNSLPGVDDCRVNVVEAGRCSI
ncbi:hypothetical protein ACSYAD_20625 [Acaryochloris marina NIES-2412]